MYLHISTASRSSQPALTGSVPLDSVSIFRHEWPLRVGQTIEDVQLRSLLVIYTSNSHITIQREQKCGARLEMSTWWRTGQQSRALP